MDVRAGGKGSVWKLCIAVAVACGVLVFAAGFLHRNAVASAIDAQQTKDAAYVHGRLTDAVGRSPLSKPLSEHMAASLEKDAGVPAGTEVRIFALDGTLVFVSGGPHSATGDTDAMASAARGDVTHAIAGDDFVVYAAIDGRGAKPVAVAAVVSDEQALLADATGLLDGARLPLVGLGVLLLVAGLVLMVRGGAAAPKASAAASPTRRDTQKVKKAEEPAKGRVSGFDTGSASAVQAPEASAPVEEGASSVPQEPKSRKTLFGRASKSSEPPSAPEPERVANASTNREVAIREALEDQLEQLRTRIQMQDEATRTLQAQLDAATSRAEEAERLALDGPRAAPSAGPAEHDLIERVRGLEGDLAQAKGAAAEAIARADDLQRTVDAPSAYGATPNTEALAAELVAVREQLAAAQQGNDEAQRMAADAEQRAASIESVRGELEVRVAQMGAKAGELEQKATELETRLREANAGGDAVRAEIASLTAALAAAQTRVTELESTVSGAPSAEELDTSTAEIARLRTELANHMERAQSAEDRVATLEADVLAAEHGVNELPVEGSAGEVDPEPAPLPVASGERVDEPSEPPNATWAMWSTSEPRQTTPAAEPERPSVMQESEEVTATVARTMWVAPSPQPSAIAQPHPDPEPEPDPAFHEASPAAEAPNVPQAPPDGRYGDVWAEAFPEPDVASEEPKEAPTEPAAPVEPTMTSSLDAEPSPQEDAVSVEDDLWALRARLVRREDNEGKDSEGQDSEGQDR
ncbi:MAG: hypothetical protein ABJB55_05940 [Actinomycetota bacterium]